MQKKQLSRVQLEKRCNECREMIDICHDFVTQLSGYKGSNAISFSLKLGKTSILTHHIPSSDVSFLSGFFMSLHVYYVNMLSDAQDQLLMGKVQITIDHIDTDNEG